MVDHLSEQTIEPAHAAIAAYYAGAVGPDASEIEDFTSTAAQVRRDLDPALGRLLGLDPTRAPTHEEIAYLLTGARTDGQPLPGRQVQRDGTLSLATELGLDPDRLPTAAEVDRVLDGCRADTGEALPQQRQALLRKRFLHVFGVEEDAGAIPLTEAVRRMREGCRGDGAPMRLSAYRDVLTTARQRVAFIDLTTSAEKSLSVAIALAPTEAERALLLAAHRDAVGDMLGIAETVIGRARRGKAGRGGAEQGAVAWLLFEHHTARPTAEIVRVDAETGHAFTHLQTVRVPGDPQTHHHAILPSCVLTPSGHVGGLDLGALSGRVHELGALYHASAAARLRKLGVEVVLDERTGAGRLTAIPDVLRNAFSKRTKVGTEAAKDFAAERGLDWTTLDSASKITLLKAGVQDPRGAKSDDLGSIDVWRAQAAALGWTPTSVIDVDNPILQADGAKRLEGAYAAAARLLGAAFQNRTVLDEVAVRTAAARGLIAGGYQGPEDVDAVVQLLEKRGLMQDGIETTLLVEPMLGPHGRPTYRATTGVHAKREAQIVALAQAAAQDRSDTLVSEKITAAAQVSGLIFDTDHGRAQAAAMMIIGTGPKISALAGAAGSGKSAVIKPLTSAWIADNREVYGISSAWRAAYALKDAGIVEDNCLATAALFAKVKAGRIVLGPRDVVVADEVGLMSTRTLLEILELRDRAGFSLVVIGDDLQASSVEAGNSLALLRRALGAKAVPEIATTVRQFAAAERELAGMARQGRICEVLDLMHETGRARLAPGSYSDAADAVAALWAERVLAHADERDFTITVLAPTNFDARAVSQAIRRQRQAWGEIGSDEVTIGAIDQAGAEFELPLAQGDHLRLYQRVNASGSGRGLLGVNGSVVQIVKIDAAGLVMRNGTGRQGLVAWSTLRDPVSGRYRLTLGGCLTIDQAQGISTDEAIFALPGGSAGCGAGRAYVALSRHRRQAFVVVGEAAERRAVAKRRPLGADGPIRVRDIWQHVGETLAYRELRTGALELLDRARAGREEALAVRRIGHARMQIRVGSPTIVMTLIRHKAIARIAAAIQAVQARRSAILGDLAKHILRLLRKGQKLDAGPRSLNRVSAEHQKRGRHSEKVMKRPHRP